MAKTTCLRVLFNVFFFLCPQMKNAGLKIKKVIGESVL